ncbi:hypothetical protein D9757_015017 [Collybiopsis confluens]|uniref:Uncharacterized protein n=1 Tax=Collybiopsis confluens TaxID=2823264 RepID=A0A8H5CCL2_9AGAR|nr:hypothetical protein D9757_015017 [Collybiopsis confluens]
MRCLILRGDRRFWISDKDCGPDPGEKWVVFRDNPREYIRKLRAIWDDSSQYWESDQCHFRIRGEPIPAKYWNVAVKPWSSRIRERWSMWKTLMQELRTFSSVEDFMDSFKQGEQQKTQVLHR